MVPGEGGHAQGFRRESRTLTFHSRSRPTTATCLHLRAFSAECWSPQPRKRGRRQRRRRHPGAGAGEARTIAVTISFPAAASGTAVAGISWPGRGCARAAFSPGSGEPRQRRGEGGGEQRAQRERVELAKLHRSTQ